MEGNERNRPREKRWKGAIGVRALNELYMREKEGGIGGGWGCGGV